MNEQLGIVSEVGFGMRDARVPILWFSVHTLEGSALQCFNLEEAGKLIEEAGCYDVRKLEGRSCVVDVNDNTIKFLRWLK